MTFSRKKHNIPPCSSQFPHKSGLSIISWRFYLFPFLSLLSPSLLPIRGGCILAVTQGIGDYSHLSTPQYTWNMLMFTSFERPPPLYKTINHSGSSNMGSGSGGAGSGSGSGGMMGYSDPRVDPATVISALLQSPVYTVGDGGKAAGMMNSVDSNSNGDDEALMAAKRGEVLRCRLSCMHVSLWTFLVFSWRVFCSAERGSCTLCVLVCLRCSFMRKG